MTSDAEIVNVQFAKSVIASKSKFVYQEAQIKKDSDKWGFMALNSFFDIYRVLRLRTLQVYLDFRRGDIEGPGHHTTSLKLLRKRAKKPDTFIL